MTTFGAVAGSKHVPYGTKVVTVAPANRAGAAPCHDPVPYGTDPVTPFGAVAGSEHVPYGTKIVTVAPANRAARRRATILFRTEQIR